MNDKFKEELGAFLDEYVVATEWVIATDKIMTLIELSQADV